MELNESSESLDQTGEQLDNVVKAMACILNQLCERNDMEISQQNHDMNPFMAFQKPAIGVLLYSKRLQQFMSCSPACFVVALLYIDRVIERASHIVINSLTIHRLLLTSLVCACKYWDDAFYMNSFYAKVGGVTTAELNKLELDFLFALDFDLHVKAHDFDQYFHELRNHVSTNKCESCGTGASTVAVAPPVSQPSANSARNAKLNAKAPVFVPQNTQPEQKPDRLPVTTKSPSQGKNPPKHSERGAMSKRKSGQSPQEPEMKRVSKESANRQDSQKGRPVDSVSHDGDDCYSEGEDALVHKIKEKWFTADQEQDLGDGMSPHCTGRNSLDCETRFSPTVISF